MIRRVFYHVLGVRNRVEWKIFWWGFWHPTAGYQESQRAIDRIVQDDGPSN
jgi:hypothetical protein